MSNVTKLKGFRKEVLAGCGGEVCNIFNYERFSSFTSNEHISDLLGKVERFRVICLIKTGEAFEQMQELSKQFPKLEVRYLSGAEFDFSTEMLITGDYVFVYDGKNDLPIENKNLAHDFMMMFELLWNRAIPCSTFQKREVNAG
ncbi:hypothetical protein HQ571_06105 [Candidatus Kuenenbacteria bacterium]|nr:hypothetical protein [Candidatus Kuenenbacteria bacterium]